MLRAKHLWRLHIGIRKTYPEYSSLWRPVSTCTESGRLMSFYHGLGMFFFGTGATLVGAIAVYYVFNKISSKEWIDDDENNNN